MIDRNSNRIGNVSFGKLLEEGASALLLLLLAGFVMMPETLGQTASLLLRLMVP